MLLTTMYKTLDSKIVPDYNSDSKKRVFTAYEIKICHSYIKLFNVFFYIPALYSNKNGHIRASQILKFSDTLRRLVSVELKNMCT